MTLRRWDLGPSFSLLVLCVIPHYPFISVLCQCSTPVIHCDIILLWGFVTGLIQHGYCSTAETIRTKFCSSPWDVLTNFQLHICFLYCCRRNSVQTRQWWSWQSYCRLQTTQSHCMRCMTRNPVTLSRRLRPHVRHSPNILIPYFLIFPSSSSVTLGHLLSFCVILFFMPLLLLFIS